MIGKIIIGIVISLLILAVLLFVTAIYCSCIVSGRNSRIDEELEMKNKSTD
jgi:hypothetical protein